MITKKRSTPHFKTRVFEHESNLISLNLSLNQQEKKTKVNKIVKEHHIEIMT